MKSDAKMRAYVMRRVYVMYWGRQLARPLPRIAAFSALAVALVSSVSVVNVVLNALAVGGVYEMTLFAVAAFANTTLFVQAVVAGILASVVWVFADTVKTVKTAILPADAEVAPVQ